MWVNLLNVLISISNNNLVVKQQEQVLIQIYFQRNTGVTRLSKRDLGLLFKEFKESKLNLIY